MPATGRNAGSRRVLAGDLAVVSLAGADAEPVLPDLARLRIRVFREFPYLYNGDLSYERWYLSTFADAPDGIVVVVFDGERVVGAATGMPLASGHDAFLKPFRERNMPVETIFYFGESVLDPAYRGRGIGHVFFDHRESHARGLCRFSETCFLAVDRPLDHPRRPSDYRPLDGFWRRRGYEPEPGFVCHFPWRDLDEAQESPKPMRLWRRRLD
jgi:GNAT superfamily N-acetyltransferase